MSETILGGPDRAAAAVDANDQPDRAGQLRALVATGDALSARLALAEEMAAALRSLIDNDDANEGDVPLAHGATWNEISAHLIKSLNDFRTALVDWREATVLHAPP